MSDWARQVWREIVKTSEALSQLHIQFLQMGGDSAEAGILKRALADPLERRAALEFLLQVGRRDSPYITHDVLELLSLDANPLGLVRGVLCSGGLSFIEPAYREHALFLAGTGDDGQIRSLANFLDDLRSPVLPEFLSIAKGRGDPDIDEVVVEYEELLARRAAGPG